MAAALRAGIAGSSGWVLQLSRAASNGNDLRLAGMTCNALSHVTADPIGACTGGQRRRPNDCPQQIFSGPPPPPFSRLPQGRRRLFFFFLLFPSQPPTDLTPFPPVSICAALSLLCAGSGLQQLVPVMAMVMAASGTLASSRRHSIIVLDRLASAKPAQVGSRPWPAARSF